MNILLTGGTGYIGSHTAVVLAQAGHRVLLYDNLSNSNPGVPDRLQTILGQRPRFVPGDIRNATLLTSATSPYGPHGSPSESGMTDVRHSRDSGNPRTSSNHHTFNLGTGTGYSVLQMVRAFEAASGQHVPYQMAGRRAGDIASCYAQADKAASQLQWQAHRSLHDMCASTWHFQGRSAAQAPTATPS